MAKAPTQAQRERRERVRELGCGLADLFWARCHGYTTIHHCGCGGGGRKDHDKIATLCWEHHLGDEGINSLTGKISRREWEKKYKTEDVLLAETAKKLGESFI